MTVAEVAESTGIPARTVRYWAGQGLVSPPKRVNGYRVYSDAAQAELRLVARAWSLGLSLDDCRRLLKGWRTGGEDWRHEVLYTLATAESACASLRKVA